jgi:hypothetical protein
MDDQVEGGTVDGNPNLFDAIRVAQDVVAANWPHPGEPGSDEYVEAQAQLICAMYRLDVDLWSGEVAAEIRQEHGKYIEVREGGQMGKHGCEHGKCPKCGKCTVKSCPNRAKCRGHK